MRCPFCGATDTQVVETRLAEDGLSVRRRRRCASCDKRFTTYENADVRLPQVVKGNGMREEFSEAKLREASAAPCTNGRCPPNWWTRRSPTSARGS